MQTSRSPLAPMHDRHRHRHRLALGLVLVLGGLLFLLWSHDRGRRRSLKPAPEVVENAARRSSYVNRALWSTPQVVPPSRTKAAPEVPAIRGRVYAMDGTALGGALVTASTFELAGNLPTAAGTARTDAGGRFTLPLTAGIYQLHASHDGYGPTATSASTGDEVSLVLPASGVVAGHVYDEARRPVHDFVIDIVAAMPAELPALPPMWSRRFTSSDGSYRIDQLPVGSVIVKASSAGYASGFSSPLSVRPGEHQDMDLTLPVGCTVLGTVEDSTGTPVPYVLVDAESRLTAGSMSALALTNSNQTQTDESGRFRLEHVAVGVLQVRAYNGDYAVTSKTIQLPDCRPSSPLKLVVSEGGSIVGVARRGDGSSLAGAKLAVSQRSIGFVNTRSDAEGHFRFTRIPAGGVWLTLEHEGQRTQLIVKVKEHEEVQQDIRLFAGGAGGLRGRVTAGARPLAGMRLMVTAFHGRSRGFDAYFPVTDADGRYSLATLPVGAYLVSLPSTTKGGSAHVADGQAVELDIDLGQNSRSEARGEEMASPPAQASLDRSERAPISVPPREPAQPTQAP